MARRLLVGLMIPFVALAVSVCGTSTPPPAEKPAAAAVPQLSAETATRMDSHFGKVRDLEDAVIRGDLESAKAAARWIAEHQDATGLPPGTESYVTATKNAAGAVAASTSIGSAGVAAAFAVAACGECHAAAKVVPKLPDVSLPVTPPPAVARMLMHKYAMDLMYRGMAGPSGTQWVQGADALKDSALTDKDAATVSKETAAAEKRVRELAGRAAQAADTGSRIAIYGELVSGCASCHAEHGMVLGPGLPKTK